MKYLAIALLFVTSVANDQPAKDAVVVNEPLLVEVINPAPVAPPVRWQLVGFTGAIYTANMGGNFGVTQKCQLEFDNSRMCSPEEVAATTSIPSGLTGVARIHVNRGTGGVIFSAAFGGQCQGWTSSAPFQGRAFTASANGRINQGADGVECPELHPIACCALVP